MGFFTLGVVDRKCGARQVAIPFRVGWGFSHVEVGGKRAKSFFVVAIPFRVGWGFSLCPVLSPQATHRVAIPFRVGWGFSPHLTRGTSPISICCRNPFQGGMGFFTRGRAGSAGAPCARTVAIPFRVGWGFSPTFWSRKIQELKCRNPFQGGMGFFTHGG